MDGGVIMALVTALWLGILTSISPCPLATNIAAVSFIGRKIGKISAVLLSGLLYGLGRTLAYIALALLLVKGITAAPETAQFVQKQMNLLMGPIFILVAMILLDWINLSFSSGKLSHKFMQHMEKSGFLGAFLMGAFFALSFCPTSAALYFGSLLPLAIKFESALLLPGAYGLGTALPVLFFAVLLAFFTGKIGTIFNKISHFEKWAQKITAWIFLLLGFYFTLTLTLKVI